MVEVAVLADDGIFLLKNVFRSGLHSFDSSDLLKEAGWRCFISDVPGESLRHLGHFIDNSTDPAKDAFFQKRGLSMKIHIAAFLCVILVGCVPTVKSEPAAGTLSTGASVLVDDGSCPPGKIKQITGGGKKSVRLKACVVKPH